ncbi:MAG: cytochrome c [Acidobacteria bacterium]|nr:cytochrome c [Acidobacteriota bacterium]
MRRPYSRNGFLVSAVLALASCRQDMHDQPRYEPLEKSHFFGDARASRPQVPGTVAQGQLRIDEHLYTGKLQGNLADSFPFPITRQVLERGQERYNIFCSPCHSKVGDGQGMIVRRGFRPPPTFHSERLRAAPPGHFFDVITNGFGSMYDYSAQLRPEERWAIVAYLKALQLSQAAGLEDVPAGERQKLSRD